MLRGHEDDLLAVGECARLAGVSREVALHIIERLGIKPRMQRRKYGHKVVYTEEQAAEVVRLVTVDGVFRADVPKRVNLSLEIVQRILKEEGVPPGTTRITPATIRRINALREQGLLYKEIAAVLGITIYHVKANVRPALRGKPGRNAGRNANGRWSYGRKKG